MERYGYVPKISFGAATWKGNRMNVRQLIELLQKAPQNADVFYINSSNVFGEDKRDVRGLTVNEGGEIEFCDHHKQQGGGEDESCPEGVKTFCAKCGRGCRLIWLVLKDGKAQWIEDDELRGPNETKNKYEFFNPHWIGDPRDNISGIYNKNIPKDASIPEYNKDTDTYRWPNEHA